MSEQADVEDAQEILRRDFSHPVQMPRPESARAISRYGLAGFGDTSLGREYGLWWLLAAAVIALVPDALDDGALAALGTIAIVLLPIGFSRLPGSLREEWHRIADDDKQASADDRALVFAKFHITAAFLVVAGWLVAVASEQGLLSWPDPAKIWLARVWLALCVLAAGAYFRLDKITGLMSTPDVWNMADDTSYHSRRFCARFVDIGVVSALSAILVATQWWDRTAPTGGIPGAREFLTGLAILGVYEVLWGYAGCSVGKLLFRLRLRRAPGVGVGRSALAPLARSVALVAIPGMWILLWASVQE